MVRDCFAKRSVPAETFPRSDAGFLFSARAPTQDDDAEQTSTHQRNG